MSLENMYMTFFCRRSITSFLQVRGEVEKLAHITDSILSKTEQVFAVVQGLDIGGVVKLDGKGVKNNYTIKETVKNERLLFVYTYSYIGYKRNLYLLFIISGQNSVIMCHYKALSFLESVFRIRFSFISMRIRIHGSASGNSGSDLKSNKFQLLFS